VKKSSRAKTKTEAKTAKAEAIEAEQERIAEILGMAGYQFPKPIEDMLFPSGGLSTNKGSGFKVRMFHFYSERFDYHWNSLWEKFITNQKAKENVVKEEMGKLGLSLMDIRRLVAGTLIPFFSARAAWEAGQEMEKQM
jgi:hypothetical protein